MPADPSDNPSLSPHPSSGSALVFHEDRDDFVRRVFARAYLGTYGFFLLLTLVASAFVAGSERGEISMLSTFGIPFVIVNIGIWSRFDIWAYQWGRRVRYEIDENQLKIFVGKKLHTTIAFADVTDWVEARSPSIRFFWTGLSLYRTFAMPEWLDQYTFYVKPSGKFGLPKAVSPPMLFRWRDRGGVEDVSAVLWERLGKPRNRSERDRPRV